MWEFLEAFDHVALRYPVGGASGVCDIWSWNEPSIVTSSVHNLEPQNLNSAKIWLSSTREIYLKKTISAVTRKSFEYKSAA